MAGCGTGGAVMGGKFPKGIINPLWFCQDDCLLPSLEEGGGVVGQSLFESDSSPGVAIQTAVAQRRASSLLSFDIVD